MHDVIEDGGVTFEELRSMGFSERTIELVDLCTYQMNIQDPAERWVLMIARLVERRDEVAWQIKLADLTDNLKQSVGLAPENRKFMIEVKAPLLIRLAKALESRSLEMSISDLVEETKRQRDDLEKVV